MKKINIMCCVIGLLGMMTVMIFSNENGKNNARTEFRNAVQIDDWPTINGLMQKDPKICEKAAADAHNEGAVVEAQTLHDLNQCYMIGVRARLPMEEDVYATPKAIGMLASLGAVLVAGMYTAAHFMSLGKCE